MLDLKNKICEVLHIGSTIPVIIKEVSKYIFYIFIYKKYNIITFSIYDDNFSEFFKFKNMNVRNIPYNIITVEAAGELEKKYGTFEVTINVPILQIKTRKRYFINYDGVTVSLLVRKKDYSRIKLRV